MKHFHLSSILLVILAGCGGSDSELDLASRDPRCVSACSQRTSEYDDVGAVCDTASRAQCLDECEVRIAGLPTLCQSCLLEHASLDADDGVYGESCVNTTCTLSSSFGMCTYQTSDSAAYRACLVKVDPRREVTCDSDFRPATDCASVCPAS